MNRFTSIFSLLLLVTSSETYGSVDSEEAGDALSWIMSQPQNHPGWIENIPRIVLVHEIARPHLSRIENVTLMAKKLNVLTAVELLKETKRQQQMSAVQVADLVNALRATCQNPRNFHGSNLLAELRNRGNNDLNYLTTPHAYLTLCVNGLTKPDDATKVYRAILGKGPDTMSIGVVALMCILPKYDYLNSSNGHNWHSSLYSFFNKTLSQTEANYLSNVYMTALTLQMLNCIPKHWTGFKTDVYSAKKNLKKALLDHQLNDGSFGDFLSTYLAIPALLDHCALDLKTMCSSNKTSAKLEEYSVEYTDSKQLKNVTFSLWIQNTATDSWARYTKVFAVGQNYTLFDVMTHAKSQSQLFNFSYDEDDKGKHIYSIANIPNDTEKGYAWKLFMEEPVIQRQNIGDRYFFWPKPYQAVHRGLNEIIVHNGDSWVFEYSRQT